jgi:hypothetical protein
MRCLLPVVLVATIAFASEAPAAESQYFPLAEGWQWEYAGDEGDATTTMVDGLQQVQGTQAIVLHWQYADGNDDELEQYYSVAEDGSVYFHGFNLDNGDIVISYRPPFLFLPPALNVGDRWCSVTQPFVGLNGDVPDGGPFEVCSEVLSFEELDLPAGIFPAYGVLQVYALTGSSDLDQGVATVFSERDVFGRPSSGRGMVTDWYSSGVGTVALDIYQYFELSSYLEPPTPVQSATWGSVKHTFR